MKHKPEPAASGYFHNRRLFLQSITTLAAGQLLLPLTGNAASFFTRMKPVTVGDIMDQMIAAVPGPRLTETVDTLKSGSRDKEVKGIVVTMFATVDVIRKTIAAGANFIIAHEPTFYNHPDETNWLKDDAVYQYKAKLLKDNDITVWRFHDYIHTIEPDPVTVAVNAQLGWTPYADKSLPNSLQIPTIPLKDLIQHLKSKLGIEKVRYIGDPAQLCSRILIMPGAAGKEKHIAGISKLHPDVLICGEISEWETAEYVRDARAEGDPIALIVLGHIASEDPGSTWVLNWLKAHYPQIPAKHIHPGNSLSFL